MGTENGAFGQAAREATSASSLLAAEAAHGRADRFAAQDALVGGLAVRALRGETIVEVAPLERGRRRRFVVRLGGLSPGERALVDELFAKERQQGRGAWFLPDEVSLKTRLLDFPAQIARNGASAHNLLDIADAERVIAPLDAAPDVVLAWAILQPLFEALYTPFTLRARHSVGETPAKCLAAWQAVAAEHADFGFAIGAHLEALRPGAGWSRRRAEEQQAHLRSLAAELASQVGLELGANYRTARLRPLIAQYTAKARADGRALRAQVVTRRFESTVAGYFGGDWLAFLDYLGTQPHPDEQIATALPEPRLYLGAAQPAAALVPSGIDEAQVRLMLRALYGDDRGESPVTRRIAVLRRYWAAFDELHAAQRPGMTSLWGLVPEGADVPRPDDTWSPYQDGLYERLLPADLLRDIEDCWGTAMVPAQPARIVSAISPHALLVETFGPALRFWQGCALTAWFLCEGPYSRTDMAGLAHYHRAELAALEELETPIDPVFFDRLVAAEARLGMPEPIRGETRETPVAGGILRVTHNFGQRRAGFERLRDIVTTARRAWAAQHLEKYLRARAEGDVGEAARRYQVRTVARGIKPPTPKQFAREATPAANRWFGGDLDALYRAIGEKPLVRPEHARRMPAARRTFVQSLYHRLGGTVERGEMNGAAQWDSPGRRERLEANRQLSDLAGRGLNYIQREEELGCPPDMDEFGRAWFTDRSSALNADPGRAWEIYVDALALARREPNEKEETAAPSAGAPPPTPPLDPATHADRSEDVGEPRTPWWRRVINAARQ